MTPVLAILESCHSVVVGKVGRVVHTGAVIVTLAWQSFYILVKSPFLFELMLFSAPSVGRRSLEFPRRSDMMMGTLVGSAANF